MLRQPLFRAISIAWQGPPSIETTPAAATEFSMNRPQKITFGELRNSGVRGILIYCADFHCSYSIAMNADQWPDDLRLPTSSRASSARYAASAARMSGRSFLPPKWALAIDQDRDSARHQVRIFPGLAEARSIGRVTGTVARRTFCFRT